MNAPGPHSVHPAFVVLQNGMSVPLDAWQLLWELENRGICVEREGDIGLSVAPCGKLTDEDREPIRRHRRPQLSE